ncbi:MAG TPA: hypothetical protein VJH68_05470 [Candidatus Nanoarchaeia archaeon]|nr:hypothetical protein [Candidatus Nanoarchaeia archaeon]
MKPPHLAINDEVSKEAVSQLRIFSMQKFRPKGRGFTPNEIFCIIIYSLTQNLLFKNKEFGTYNKSPLSVLISVSKKPIFSTLP